MLWEEITTTDLKEAAATHGVCVLPLGICEKHGNHLPLGTDMIIARGVAKEATKIEPAVVFPQYYLSQGRECRHYAGCISASLELIMAALQEMCDEIARNGFKKILILNGHGGNNGFVNFFGFKTLGLNKDYTVYVNSLYDVTPERQARIEHCTKGAPLDHAGQLETSLVMHLRPDLVHIERQDVAEGHNQGRAKHLDDLKVFTGLNWYGSYPRHYGGNHKSATADLGKSIFDIYVEHASEVIREIKADTVLPAFFEEHNKLVRNPL